MNPTPTTSAAEAAFDRELLTTAFNDYLFDDFERLESVQEGVESHAYQSVAGLLQDSTACVSYIPSVPRTLLELIRELKSEDANFYSILSIIKDDTGLLGEIIKATNCPLYRPRTGKILSLEKAISMLGVVRVTQIATMVLMRKIIDNEHSPYRSLVNKAWGYCLRCAEACQILGEPEKEFENYLLGLVHDVGRTAVLNCCITEMHKEQFDMLEQHAAVSRLMEDYSARISTTIAKQWGLSAFYTNAYDSFETLRQDKLEERAYRQRSEAFHTLEKGTLSAMLYSLSCAGFILRDDGFEILVAAGIEDRLVGKIFARFDLADATLI